MRNSGYGDLLHKRIGIPNPPTFVTSVSRRAPITFSRLRLDCAGRTFHSLPAEDGYACNVNFLKQASCARKTRVEERHFLGEGDSMMLDRREASTVTMYSPLDTVRLYVPRLTLQDFVREHYGSSEVHEAASSSNARSNPLQHRRLS
jgi:hypothetical protein